jgi:hypothetical protein
MAGLGRPVAPVVGSLTHPVMPNLVMLWKMSPLRPAARSSECGRVPGCGRGAPPAGAGSQAQTEAREGWWGPGPAAGGGAGPAHQGYLLGLNSNSNSKLGGFRSPVFLALSRTRTLASQQPRNQPTPRRTKFGDGTFWPVWELHWELHWELY